MALILGEEVESCQCVNRTNKGAETFWGDIAISCVDFGVMVLIKELGVRKRAVSQLAMILPSH